MNRTIEEIQQLAAQHGLTLKPESIQLEESGADFLAAFADDSDGTPWVLRMPRREDVLPRADSEGRALELIRRQLPVAVPEWRINSPELIAYPRLAGTPAVVEGEAYVWHVPAPPPHAPFIESLAGALAALHTTSHEAAAEAGLRILSPTAVREAAAEKIARAGKILDVPAIIWKRWQAWLINDELWPPFSALIHGDLHPGHLLVDQDGRVTGIIDWTEAEVSDPAIDFVFAYWILGEKVLRQLLKRYQAAGGRVWPGMVQQIGARQSLMPAVVAAFAEDSGHLEYLEFARTLLAAQEAELSA